MVSAGDTLLSNISRPNILSVFSLYSPKEVSRRLHNLREHLVSNLLSLGGCKEEDRKRVRKWVLEHVPAQSAHFWAKTDVNIQCTGTKMMEVLNVDARPWKSRPALWDVARGARIKTWSFKSKRLLPGAQYFRIFSVTRHPLTFTSFALLIWTTLQVL